jgi:hypothetical protein
MRQLNHIRSQKRDTFALSTLAIAAVLAACGTDEIVDPPYQPELLGVQLLENPHNTISAKVVVGARYVDSAYVRFWRDGEEPRRSPSYFFGGDTVVTVPVLGLDTASTYTIETSIVILDSVVPGVDTSVFQAGILPGWVPRAGTLGSDTTAGLLALSYAEGPVIVDNTGRVVWYRYSPNGRLNSFQLHPDGRNTHMGHNDPAGWFHVWDDFGEEVDSLSCVGYSTRFHDVMIRPDGTTWIMCNETQRMDLTAYGGRPDADVVGTVVQHLARDGALLWEWRTFDHVLITDIPESARISAVVNLTHGNAITFDLAGNLLLSFRSLNQVMNVDVATGDVLWRLGGVRNDFTFLNDSKGFFEGQHGVRVVAPGVIQLLDNGVVAPSRLVRYQIDPAASTVLTAHEFIDSPTTHTPVGGGTDAYPNGHGAVTFGLAGRVVEVDEVGNRAWELTGIDSLYVFRVQRISSLYAPERIAAGR